MKKTRQIKITRILWCLTVAVLTLATSDVLAFFHIQLERVIVQERPHEKDPVEISDFVVSGQAIRAGDKFSASGQWLRDLTFKVTNKHSKPVTYVQVNLDFPEVRHNGVMMQHQMFLGRHPVFDKPINSKPLRIAPGESFSASLEDDYGEIKKSIEFVAPANANLVNKITLRLSEVGFEDGTIYSGGSIFRRNPDPNASRKWIKVVE